MKKLITVIIVCALISVAGGVYAFDNLSETETELVDDPWATHPWLTVTTNPIITAPPITTTSESPPDIITTPITSEPDITTPEPDITTERPPDFILTSPPVTQTEPPEETTSPPEETTTEPEESTSPPDVTNFTPETAYSPPPDETLAQTDENADNTYGAGIIGGDDDNNGELDVTFRPPGDPLLIPLIILAATLACAVIALPFVFKYYYRKRIYRY